MSALATQPSASKHLQLPKIIHSASKLGNPLTMNVTARGVSRASSLGDLADKIENVGRPLAFEQHDDSMSFFMNSKNNIRLNSSSKRSTLSSLKSTSINVPPTANNAQYEVPDGVKAVYSPSLSGKPSIPIFGKKQEIASGRKSAIRLSATQTSKVEIDEIMNTLRDKLRSSNNEIRIKFRNADPDGKGLVTKDALAHIIASALGPGKPFNHQQFQKLLEHLGLKTKSTVKFEEFASCFGEISRPESSSTNEWVDPLRSGSQAPVTRKATQMFIILKEKCKQKSKDISSLVPQLIGGNPNRIFKPELLNVIHQMSVKMENDEYDKLWKKFDNENLGVVHSEVFLKKLGIFEANDRETPRRNEPLTEDLPPLETTRKSVTKSSSKNPIEKWLKSKFREGFAQMRASFVDLDVLGTGHVKKDQFLNVLRRYGLKLEANLLDAFLIRCDIPSDNNQISYTRFLEKFQTRSEQGLTYKAIAGNLDTERAESAIGQIEKKLLRMFQKDFLALLGTFRKIDRNKTNMISRQEFRAALESHFGVELSDAEFAEFAQDLPIEDNKIKYLEFMTRFDTDDTASLFDAPSLLGDNHRSGPSKWEAIQEEETEDLVSSRLDKHQQIQQKAPLRVKQLKAALKDAIKNRYKDVENNWSEIDPSNTGEMKKETMWELIKALKFTLKFSKDDVDELWKEFLLKDNNKLEYWQFVRHFGYSKRSAAFENAKRAPPKKGDSDMMLTSNKLGRDSILIRGSVHAKIRLQCEELRRNFIEMDPYKSGQLLKDEFKETLLEFCPELNEQEMDFICEKYENPFDSRINYQLFLQPYTAYQKVQQGGKSPRADTNDPLVQKLKYRLCDQYKELRRIFKTKDYKQNGTIPVSAFTDVLKSTKISLNDEETYSLLNKLDVEMTGQINYIKFLNEMVKN